MTRMASLPEGFWLCPNCDYGNNVTTCKCGYSKEGKAVQDGQITQAMAEEILRKETLAENDLQRWVEGELRRRGIWYLHLSHRSREKKGTPDLIFAHPNLNGKLVGMELKTASGKTSKEQDAAMCNIEANGGWCMVCRTRFDVLEVLDNDAFAELFYTFG